MTGIHRLHDATGILLADEFGDSVVKADGAAPTDSESGYVPGALYVDTLNARQYSNLGSASSSDWAEIGGKRDVIAVTDATKTLDAGDAGALVILDKSGGIVVTLPESNAANAGVFFDFVVKTTGNVTIASSRTADLWYGSINVENPTGAQGKFFIPAIGSSDDRLVADSAAKGNVAGGYIRVELGGANVVVVSGTLAGSSSPATPFA